MRDYIIPVRQDAKLSIRMDPTKNDTNYLISSILTTSYHRDSNELESKNSAQFELKGMKRILKSSPSRLVLMGLLAISNTYGMIKSDWTAAFLVQGIRTCKHLSITAICSKT